MAVIPDVSGRVKRLQMYERELARKMAFDEKFGSRDHGDLLRRSRFNDFQGLSTDMFTVDVEKNPNLNA